jgi:hypothetical protein
MAQYIKQGNIFGRIGSGIGKGLAEQVPKEIERHRMNQGLQQLEQDSANLNPQQLFFRALQSYGLADKPEVVKQIGQLAKNQGMRNSYGNIGQNNEGLQPVSSKNTIDTIRNTPLVASARNKQNQTQESDIVKPQEEGQPQVVQTNPLRPEAIPKNPWTPQRRNQERNAVAKQFPWMEPNEINEMAAENEQRELAQPAAEQAKDAYNQKQSDEIRDAFIKRAELLTQKKGDELFKDVTGEMQNNFIRTVQKDIRENPNLTVEDVVNKRANQLLAIPKAKRNIDNLASSHGILDAINPYARKEVVKKIQDAADIFSKVGDSEELYNILKNKNGFGFSPQWAAWGAYPRSKKITSFSNSIKPQLGGDYIKTAKYYASQVGKLIGDEDSVLSVYRELKNKNPNFDDATFFDELRNMKDEARFNDRQRLEFIEGNPDFFSNWGDKAVFPLTQGGIL